MMHVGDIMCTVGGYQPLYIEYRGDIMSTVGVLK